MCFFLVYYTCIARAYGSYNSGGIIGHEPQCQGGDGVIKMHDGKSEICMTEGSSVSYGWNVREGWIKYSLQSLVVTCLKQM